MPDSAAPSSEDAELRAHVQEALSASYDVEQEIGRGGMGIVYRARDKRLKRHVAIKLLPPELSFRRDIRSRFLREAETAAQLSHPNIVPIYSVDEVGNLVFFVMACIDGDNLATLLQKRGPLPCENVRRWFTEIADALAYAHARGVIHRDIKPDNILLDGIDGRALVTDFGIARAMVDSGETSRLTATGMAIGTPAYMSPEQASGDRDLDGRSDLYSLGVVAYQMLVGEPPFVGGTTPALLVKHLAEMPVPVSLRRQDVPPDLAMIVMRLLEKNPDNRFQSAPEVVQALKTGIVPPAPQAFAAGSPGASRGAPGSGMSFGALPQNAGRMANSASAYSPPSYQAPTYQANTAQSSGHAYPPPQYTEDDRDHQPTTADIARWEAAPVLKFRKSLAPYLFINGALLVVSIFGGKEFFGFSTLWTIWIAWKYAKLWSDGYDWKDVLRQPRHRMFGEVLSDVFDSVVSIFSRSKREELRAQGRRSRLSGVFTPSFPAMGGPPLGLHGGDRLVSNKKGYTPPAAPARDDELGEYAIAVRAARADREEIGRLLATIPAEERARISEVANTSVELANKIEIIALDLARFDRAQGNDRAHDVDAEITSLELEANPLDVQRSEARVRRLAQLRRDRRAIVENIRRRDVRRGQFESCRIALENVRLDLVRLRTGNSSVQSVTLIAEQAMALARDVDIAVQAAGEMRDVTRSRTANAAG